MIGNFATKGYKLEKIKNKVSRANNISGDQTIRPSNKKKSNRIPFITTYDRRLPPFSNILRKHWKVLKILKENSLLVVAKHATLKISAIQL